jgi:hypothetical protein
MSDIQVFQDYYYLWKTEYIHPEDMRLVRKVTCYDELVRELIPRYRELAKHNSPSLRIDYERAALSKASNITCSHGDYWSDFYFHEKAGIHDFSPTKMNFLPEANRKTASLIVTALNKLKNLAWVYALCVKDMPNYDEHPLRAVILAEMESVGVDATSYDETVTLMRDIQQDFEGAIKRYHAKKEDAAPVGGASTSS